MNQTPDPQSNQGQNPQGTNHGFNSYDPFDPFGFNPMGGGQPANGQQQASPNPQGQPANGQQQGAPVPPTPVQQQPMYNPAAAASVSPAPVQQQPTYNPAAGAPASQGPPVPPAPVQQQPMYNPAAGAPAGQGPPVPPAPVQQQPMYNPAAGAPAGQGTPIPQPPVQQQAMYNPAAGAPAGQGPPVPGGAYPPHPNPGAAQTQQAAEPPKPANFQLGQLIDLSQTVVKITTNHPNVDTNLFLSLLAQSISLSKAEKMRIITSFPTLSLFQINELIRIFQDEKVEFAKLPEKNVPELEKLAKKHALDWESIEHDFQQEEIKKKELEAQQKLRDKFGL